MSWVGKSTAAAAVAAGAVAVGGAIRRGRGAWPEIRSTDHRESRWQAVTVNRPREELLTDGGLPEPLAALGDGVEVRMRRAPGGRGTELAARVRAHQRLAGMAAHVTGDDPGLAVRTALRQTKQLAETGELLRAGRPVTTRRTVLDRPLELAIEQAREDRL